MEFLGDTPNGTVVDISNNVDARYAVGKTDDHGVVWDINAGTILADFGPFTNAEEISSDGTKVIGSKNFFTIPPSSELIVWSSHDNWQNWN